MVSYYKEAASQVEPGNEFSFSPSLQRSVTCCSFPLKIFCRWFWLFTEHTGPRKMTYIHKSLHLVQPSLLIGRVSEILSLRNCIYLQEEYLWRHTVSFSARKVSFVIINSFKRFEILQTGLIYNFEFFLLTWNTSEFERMGQIFTSVLTVIWIDTYTKEKKKMSIFLSSFMGPGCFLRKFPLPDSPVMSVKFLITQDAIQY